MFKISIDAYDVVETYVQNTLESNDKLVTKLCKQCFY